MPKAYDTWTVLPHGPLQKLTENLWRVEGSLPDMSLKRVMTVARFDDGRLVIHGAVALDDPSMAEIEAWGTPALLVVPNGWHRLDVKAYKARYPDLQVVCPAGSAEKVSQVVRVDLTYEQFPADGKIRLEHLDGVGRLEGVLHVRSDDGWTLAFNDVLFNQPHLPGLMGLFMRLIGSTGGPKVTVVGKLFIVKQRPELREHLQRLAALPDLRRVIVMHGTTVEDQPAEMLRTVAAGL